MIAQLTKTSGVPPSFIASSAGGHNVQWLAIVTMLVKLGGPSAIHAVKRMWLREVAALYCLMDLMRGARAEFLNLPPTVFAIVLHVKPDVGRATHRTYRNPIWEMAIAAP